MSDDARFDPRFDPAFQPGYTGPIATSKPVQKPVIGDPPQPLAAPSPAPSAAQGTAPASGATAFFASSRLAEDEYDEPAPRRANPFLIVLGAVALVLVGGGLYLVSRLRDLFDDTQSGSNFDYVTLQVLMYAAPMVIALGLATGIGVLFIFATRWGRR